MPLPIQRGLLVSTEIPAAARAFSAGLERLAAGDGDPRTAMRTASAADPRFILPRLAELPEGGRGADLSAASAKASLQPWERSHIEVVLARADEANDVWAIRALAHVQRFPGDGWMFARLFAYAFFEGDASLRALISAQAGELVKCFPGDDEYRCRWSRCLAEMGFAHRALRVLGNITERHPDWPAAWHARVHALHGLGRHEEAAEICAALRGRGGRFDAHLAWHEALVELSAGRIRRASALFFECFGPTVNEGVLPLAIADLAGFCWAHIAATGQPPPQRVELRQYHARTAGEQRGAHVELQRALLGGAIAFADDEASAELGPFALAVARRDWGALERAIGAICRGTLDECGGTQLQRAGLGLMWLAAARDMGEAAKATRLPAKLEFCGHHPMVAQLLQGAELAA